MKDICIRPFDEKDRPLLEVARRAFTAAELETPHDYMAPRVETAVAVKGDIRKGEAMASLTGTISVSLDPLLRVPGYSPEDYLAALFKLEAVLTYMAQTIGAVDAYIAIPNGVTEEEIAAAKGYARIVRRCGYQETAQNCKIFRRALYPVPAAAETGNDPIESGTVEASTESADDQKFDLASAASH